jgi:hypothetical protein
MDLTDAINLLVLKIDAHAGADDPQEYAHATTAIHQFQFPRNKSRQS